jgi:Fe-S cluster assembly iron-binding protein IscA
MLRITNRAAEHLVRVRREKGLTSSALPRFVRREGRLALTFARGPESGDRLVDSGRISTLVAASASDLMDDATIDVKVKSEGGRAALMVHRERRDVGAPSGARTARATG